PPGVVPRGGDLIIPKEQRDVAAKQPNPVKVSEASVAIGKERFATFCVPCHGPEGKGGTTGPVATKFIPTPDLTNAELQKQGTDARWSPSVRRIALTTAGFLPISFLLLLVLYTGQTVLYPWVTTPIPAKAGWLNVPFFWLRTYACAAVLFAVCFAFVRALLRDAIPPEDERERAHRNRVAVIL